MYARNYQKHLDISGNKADKNIRLEVSLLYSEFL